MTQQIINWVVSGSSWAIAESAIEDLGVLSRDLSVLVRNPWFIFTTTDSQRALRSHREKTDHYSNWAIFFARDCISISSTGEFFKQTHFWTLDASKSSRLTIRVKAISDPRFGQYIFW
jgi:hypothetical protein